LGGYRGYTRVVFQAVERVLRYPGAEAKAAMYDALARIRAFYPVAVDDFLDANDFPDSIRAQIRSHTPPESFGDLFTLKGSKFTVDALITDPQMRGLVQWVFQMAFQCRNVNEFLEQLFMKIANLAYGEELFALKERQLI
jgi:hypothetical protein